MAVKFTISGSTRRTSSFLAKARNGSFYANLDRLAQKGATALSAATPVDSSATANAWTYEIKQEASRTTIYWINENRVNGVNIAVILQYGHATGTGGYVAGRDYITPAIEPIFKEIADEVWKRVKQA